MKALCDARWYVRQEVVVTLGGLINPPEEVITALLSTLEDPEAEAEVVENVVATLLKKLNEDSSELVRNAATYAMGRLQNPSEKIVFSLLKAWKCDQHPWVRISAAEVLEGLKELTEDIIPHSLKLLKKREKKKRMQQLKCYLNPGV